MRVLPLFILSLFAAVAFAGEECPPRYSYCGFSGPAQWPNLAIPDNECGGKKQSPINLAPLLAQKPMPADVIKVEYKAVDATIENTGHDIRVIPKGDAGGIKIGEKEIYYPLDNFHFHTPSEHRIFGVAASAEIHIVHKRVEGNKTDYAVIGVMLNAGARYAALKPVFDNLQTKVCAKSQPVLINFKELLTELTSYYTYVGSLTTPPCTEGVNWYVLHKTLTIGEADLTALVELGPNDRPPPKNPKPLDVTYIRPK